MCCARLIICTFWKTLCHGKTSTRRPCGAKAALSELIERRFGWQPMPLMTAVHPIVLLPTMTHTASRFSGICARLRALFLVHEMDDCDLGAPPSCISRRAVLILENSCAVESKSANWTFPMFFSTANWLIVANDSAAIRTSFSPSRMTMFFETTQDHIVALALMPEPLLLGLSLICCWFRMLRIVYFSHIFSIRTSGMGFCPIAGIWQGPVFGDWQMRANSFVS